MGSTFQLQYATSVSYALEVSVYLSFSFLFFFKMLVAILLGTHASAYFIFGIFISIYFFYHDLCHVILGKCIYFFGFCLCYMGLQILGNSNAENKKRVIGKGTYLVVGNSGDGETYDTAAT